VQALRLTFSPNIEHDHAGDEHQTDQLRVGDQTFYDVAARFITPKDFDDRPAD
jgi:hypothetical protein